MTQILPKILPLGEQRRMCYPVGTYTKEIIDYSKLMSENLKQIYSCGSTLTFCVRGSSGAILAGTILSMMPEHDIYICHVKKDGENSHSDSRSCKPVGKKVFIDDFISSGNTLNEVVDKIGRDIDTVCVSGAVYYPTIEHFDIRYVICGYFKE